MVHSCTQLHGVRSFRKSSCCTCSQQGHKYLHCRDDTEAPDGQSQVRRSLNGGRSQVNCYDAATPTHAWKFRLLAFFDQVMRQEQRYWAIRGSKIHHDADMACKYDGDILGKHVHEFRSHRGCKMGSCRQPRTGWDLGRKHLVPCGDGGVVL